MIRRTIAATIRLLESIDFLPFNNFAKYWMCAFGLSCPPIQVLVVLHVNKELRPTCIGLWRLICHRQSPFQIRNPLDKLVFDVAIFISSMFFSCAAFECGFRWSRALSSIFVKCPVIDMRILCKRTAKLNTVLSSRVHKEQLRRIRFQRSCQLYVSTSYAYLWRNPMDI